MAKIIEENYREHPAISNSDLKLLKKRPRDFYDIKIGDGERAWKDAFKLGTLLDLTCLNPEKKKEEWILCDVDAPTTEYHISYVENRMAGMSPIEAYKNSKYKVSNKSDSKIEEKAKELEDQYKDYLDFMEEAEGKKQYTPDDDYAINQMKMAIMGHKAASRLILADSGKPHEHFYSHLAINFKLGDIDAKGELDRMIVDTKNKVLTIIDLKSTGKPIYSFGWQAKKRDYPRQLLIYGEAGVQFCEEQGFINDDLEEWRVEYRLVAVEKTPPFECRVFEVPRIALQEALEDLNELLDRYKWHVENEAWEHTREYYENGGIEPLDYRPDPSNILTQMMGRASGRRQQAKPQPLSEEG